MEKQSFLTIGKIIEGKSAWETAIYEVSAFVKTRKPRILRMKFNFFRRVSRPNEGKSLIFNEKPLLSFEKRVFDESKLEFWTP